ncbi:hypothetical protein J4430_01110 [Candidatus Woesearchaeota archaeon]|nr:hypothetical protein [Candidatus Woesearchaeota archaeon]
MEETHHTDKGLKIVGFVDSKGQWKFKVDLKKVNKLEAIAILEILKASLVKESGIQTESKG